MVRGRARRSSARRRSASERSAAVGRHTWFAGGSTRCWTECFDLPSSWLRRLLGREDGGIERLLNRRRGSGAWVALEESDNDPTVFWSKSRRHSICLDTTRIAMGTPSSRTPRTWSRPGAPMFWCSTTSRHHESERPTTGGRSACLRPHAVHVVIGTATPTLRLAGLRAQAQLREVPFRRPPFRQRGRGSPAQRPPRPRGIPKMCARLSIAPKLGRSEELAAVLSSTTRPPSIGRRLRRRRPAHRRLSARRGACWSRLRMTCAPSCSRPRSSTVCTRHVRADTGRSGAQECWSTGPAPPLPPPARSSTSLVSLPLPVRRVAATATRRTASRSATAGGGLAAGERPSHDAIRHHLAGGDPERRPS